MSTVTLSTQERSEPVSWPSRGVDTTVGIYWVRRCSLGRALSSVLSSTLGSIKDFSAKYPAVLSGYIIYSYLFIAMMRFFLKAKAGELALYDIYETFDALPFMWLLASALVKIIETRTRLHNSEKERILNLRELETRQTQLDTMHEVARGFQHRINNPLAIIALTLGSMKRAAVAGQVVLSRMTLIEDATSRITQAVEDFSRAEKYEVENVGHVVGSMARPASLECSA